MSKLVKTIIAIALIAVLAVALVACDDTTPEEQLFYTVQFHANGGVGDVLTQSMEVGKATALDNNAFSKQAFTFAGWATSADGEVAYSDGQSVTDLAEANQTITLYAVWQEEGDVVVNYTITFLANGGTGSMPAQSIASDSTSVALNANTFSKAGFTFAGWATSADGEVAYTDGQAIRDLASNMTLFAVWQEEAAAATNYIVIFHANGGTGSMPDQQFTSDDVSAVLDACTFEKEGYTFIGWATSNKGQVAYQDGQSVSGMAFDTNQITLYAVWDKNFVLDERPAVPATSLLIEDAENKGNSDLQAEWAVAKYTSTWVESTASITSAYGYNSTAIKLNYWDNTVAYRYGKDYSTANDYNVLSFDVKGNGISTLTIQLHDEDGIYIQYRLNTMPSIWTHYEINVEDEGWKVFFDGGEYPLLAAMKFVGLNSYYDVFKHFSRAYLITKGNTPNGANAICFLDNIRFEQTENKASTNSAIIYDLGGEYSAQLTDGTVVSVKLAENMTSAVVKTLNLESNLSFDADVALENNELTLSDTGLNMTLSVIGNGEKLSVTSADLPALADALFHKVYVVDDFEGHTATGTGFDMAHPDLDMVDGLRGAYYAEYYLSGVMGSPLGGNNWSLMEGDANYISLSAEGRTGNAMQLLSRNSGNSRYLTMGLVNNTARSLGRGTALSFWVKNTSTISINVASIKVSYNPALSNENITGFSSASGIAKVLPAGSDWVQFTVALDSTKDVYGIVLVINGNYTKSAYVLVDDIQIYTADIYAEYEDPSTKPPVPEFANVALDFEGETPQTDFNNENWLQERYGESGWVTVSSQMRVRTKNDSVVVNTYTTKNATYRYTYNANGVALGKANHFSIDLGNYFDGAGDIEMKISILDTNGHTVYLYGSASEWYTLGVTTALETLSTDFEQVEVQSISITLRGTIGSSQYAYMDNLMLNNASEE